MSAAGDRARLSPAVDLSARDRAILRSAQGRRDVVIAGIPRSGSTLACHLLNRFPDTVALHEPFSLSGFRRWPLLPVGAEQALAGIEAFFASARASLRERGEVVSKHANGQIPDNPIGEGGGAASLRTVVRRLARRVGDGRVLRRGRVVRGLVRVGKPLGDDFLLCVKHPSIVTGLLPRLLDRYPCFATVRNPVAVLGSWNSIEFAVSDGRSRAAERLDPQLRDRLDRCADRGERQLRLLDWYFERIASWLPPARILRYEDVVATGGTLLARIAGRATAVHKPLESRNRSPEYDSALVLELGERLLASPGAWADFYAPDSLERLLAELEAQVRLQAAPSAPARRPDAPSGEEEAPEPARGSL